MCIWRLPFFQHIHTVFVLWNDAWNIIMNFLRILFRGASSRASQGSQPQGHCHSRQCLVSLQSLLYISSASTRPKRKISNENFYSYLYSRESPPTFQRNISPLSSGSKRKPRKNAARIRQQALFACSRVYILFHSDLLLGLLFDPEDWYDTFF
jgi:hypothetical protein